jgi:hypothetical protein
MKITKNNATFHSSNRGIKRIGGLSFIECSHKLNKDVLCHG